MTNDIIIESLTKRFDDNQVLKGIDLHVQDGEFFTLLGPSGCGKTTLLRAIAGFERPTSGRILIGGDDIGDVDVWRRNIGVVFQNYALWPHMTVAENVAYGLKMRKVPRDETRTRVREALEMIDMAHVADRHPGELSGGQQQRVAIARALVFRPRVLLFDEPLSNLDAQLRVKMRADILELQRELGITSIYVTHDQEEALEMSDRIAVLDAGKVLQIGTPAQVYRAPVSTRVADFVGRSNFVPGHVTSGTFTSAATNFSAPASERGDGPAVMCFRPEDATVASAGDTQVLVGATVRKLSFRGSHTLAELDLPDGSAVMADLPPDLELGSAADLAVGRYVILDGEMATA